MGIFSRAARSFVASAEPLPKKDTTPETGNLQPWQKQSWDFFHELGELHYAGGFYRRMLSNLRLFVEERDAQGGWAETTNERLAEQLERLESASGGLAKLQGTYGELVFVQGECYLACTIEDEGSECWEMISVSELSYSKSMGQYRRQTHKSGANPRIIPETDPEDPQPGTMIAYRFMHADPQYSGDPDAPMRAVLEDCQELWLLKQAVRNTARNRVAGNGELVMPSWLGSAMVDAGDGTLVSKTAKMIYDATVTPISDETSASAVAPVIVFAEMPPMGQGSLKDNIFHIDVRGAALYQETTLRDECIRRIEIGLDMPGGSLLGMQNTNHWNAWAIDESAWKNHGEPVAREFVGYLTAALISPIAAEIGLDPRDVRVWYDEAEVVEDPDRTAAAAEALDRFAISEDAYRRATNWKDEDAMSPDEFDRRAVIGKQPRGTSPTESGTNPPAGASAERIIGMAESGVVRCYEKAGSRARSQIKAANLQARINGAQNHDVCVKVGVDCGLDATELVRDGTQPLLAQMLRMGLEPGLSRTLARMVEEHAAATLFDPMAPPLGEDVLQICGLLARKV